MGSLISGKTPVVPVGLFQDDDPVYEWNNTEDGQDIDLGARESTIREGEHFRSDERPAGYVPFQYPHPLTASLDAPTNLRIVR